MMTVKYVGGHLDGHSEEQKDRSSLMRFISSHKGLVSSLGTRISQPTLDVYEFSETLSDRDKRIAVYELQHQLSLDNASNFMNNEGNSSVDF